MNRFLPIRLPAQNRENFMNYRNIAFTLLLTATLTGCMTFPGDYGRSYAPGMGCVIVGWGDQPNNVGHRTSGISFQGAGSSNYGAIGFSHLAMKSVAHGTIFKDKDGHGIVAVRYLPAGIYEFFDPYVTVVPSLGLVYTYKPRDRVSIPFRVKANECTYVGRMLLNPKKVEFLWISRKDADLRVVERELPAGFAVREEVTPRPVGTLFVTE